MKLNKKNIIIAFILLIFSNNLNAEMVKILDEIYEYDELSQTGNASCEALEEKIKTKAIRQVAGEFLDQGLLEICNLSEDEEKCVSNTVTFLSLGAGKITNFTITDGPHRKENSSTLTGFKQCRMSANVEVKKIKIKDVNFDFNLDINQEYFKAPIITDCNIETTLCAQAPKLIIKISSSTEKMYFYIFSWYPYLKDKYKIKKVYSSNQIVKNTFNLPTFVVGFPPEQLNNSVNEFIYVLGTNKKIIFLDEYDERDFNLKIIELYEAKNIKIREKKQSILIIKK